MAASPGSPIRYLFGAFGFAIGIIAASGLEFLVFELFQLLSRGTIRPSGPGWIVMPLLTGVSLAKVGASVDEIFWTNKLFGSMRRFKVYVAACCGWLLATIGWLVLADPFRTHYSMTDSDWVLVLKVALVFPCLLLAAFLVLGFLFPVPHTGERADV